MLLDLYGEYKPHQSNLDLLAYANKYGVLNYEIADKLGMDVVTWWQLLSEPFCDEDKRYFAKIIRQIFELRYRETRESSPKTIAGKRMCAKYEAAFRGHCAFRDMAVWTGQTRDYYEGRRAE